MPTQIEAGAAAVGVFGFGDNDGMIQCPGKLSFPTAELAFWWQKFRGNDPVWLSCGGPLWKRKIAF